MTMCLRKRHSIPWHEAGNNPRGKLCQLHAGLLASSVHSEPFYYPPAKLDSALPQLSPLPPLLIPLRTVLLPQPRLRLSFFKASPHPWSQPSALSPTRRVDTPTGSAFPQLWEGGVSILLSPSEGRAAYGYSTASKERQQSWSKDKILIQQRICRYPSGVKTWFLVAQANNMNSKPSR